MELTGVEYDEDSYNFSFTYVVEFIAMLLFFLSLIIFFFLLQCKFLAKIIGHTINLCNFRL